MNKRKSATSARKSTNAKIEEYIRELLCDLPSYEFEMVKFAILSEIDKL